MCYFCRKLLTKNARKWKTLCPFVTLPSYNQLNQALSTSMAESVFRAEHRVFTEKGANDKRPTASSARFGAIGQVWAPTKKASMGLQKKTEDDKKSKDDASPEFTAEFAALCFK
jgi:hypothetical protein